MCVEAASIWARGERSQFGSRPGNPTDNAFFESFNGSFRDECFEQPITFDMFGRAIAEFGAIEWLQGNEIPYTKE